MITASSAFPGVPSSLRRERGLSQRQVAAELGISQALLSHYENGLREPRLEFVVEVCNYYGVTADYILGRTARSQSCQELQEIADSLRELSRRADEILGNSAPSPEDGT